MRKFLFVLSATSLARSFNTNIIKEVPGVLPNEKELYQVRYEFYKFVSDRGFLGTMDDVIVTGIFQIEM